MTPVYAWPPVGATAHEWTVLDPIRASRSGLTGRRYVSAHARRRRAVSLTVNGLGRDGAGYVEALKDYLRGGVGLVRLRSIRNPLFTRLPARELLGAERLDWTTEAEAMGWTTGAEPMLWLTGAVIGATLTTDAAGFPAALLTGLPASATVAAPGDYIEVFPTLGAAAGEVRRLAKPVVTDATGAATARVTEAFSFATAARATLGATDTGVFEALEIPRAIQPAGQQFEYDWRFLEVFADEVGGFEEFDPWS